MDHNGEPRPMLHHTQSIFASDEANGFHVYGDCVRACIAGIFGLHLDAVPHFMAFDWWEGAITLWTRGWGLNATWVPAEPLPDDPCVLLGKSPRGRGHAVVGWGGQVRWDPHPSRDGLASIETAIVFPKWDPHGDPCWVCGHRKPAQSTDSATQPGTPQ
jgi:hypothetical protein